MQNLGKDPRAGIACKGHELWSKTLDDVFSGENRGHYEGEFNCSTVHLSGFSHIILEDLEC